MCSHPVNRFDTFHKRRPSKCRRRVLIYIQALCYLRADRANGTNPYGSLKGAMGICSTSRTVSTYTRI